MTRLVFRVPGREAPGFLRRQMRALEFRDRLQGDDVSAATVQALVEFLAEFVAEPEEIEARREALMEASQQEFEDLLTAIGGQAEAGPL